MLTMLIGADWVANRNEILNRIAADVAGQKSGRVLVVPELISHDTERRLCKTAGDTCSRYAQVLSFSRLANRVADFDGKSMRPCLDNGGRLVAMASATKQLHSKLKAYASVETMPEFFTGLLDAVDEFKRSCITASDLRDASKKTEGSLAQKLEELSLLLESYDSVCARGLCDPRDQMTWLLEELEESTYGKEHVFYIDGFPDFTRQHMAIIQHLCLVSDVTISFTCDKVGSEDLAFIKAGQTALELLQYAKENGIAINILTVPDGRETTRPVRERLFHGDIEPIAQNCLITYKTDTVYQECEAALETVLECVSQGARYRDINIVSADLGAHRNLLEMLFEKCDIPVYISGTEDILDEPAIATVFAALDAALGGFERNDVLQYLKSMLSPLDLDSCDMVENYALLWGISGKQWEQEWTNHPYGLGQKWTPATTDRLAAVNKARKLAIEPLSQLSKDLRASSDLGQEVLALYHFLENIKYSKKLDEYAKSFEQSGNGRQAQILNQLWDILINALEQLYNTLGNTGWEAENFSRLLKLLISQYDVGTIPPVLDAVNIGPVNAMRCQQCEYLILLGACEGVLPGYKGSAGVLTDQERFSLRQLGVPLTGGAMDGIHAEFADIYGVISSAQKAITVSYSAGEPSFVYKRLAMLAGGEKAPETFLGAARASMVDASAYLLRHNASSLAEELGVSSQYRLLADRRSHRLGDVLPENIKKLYGTELLLSASQIDRFALCRMAYFLQYGLFAKERKPAQIDPAEFGTYVHAVMEDTVKEVMRCGGFKTVSADEMVAIAQRYSEDYAKEQFSELGSERLNYLFRRNWHELELIVRELWDEMQNADFEPVGFEVAFGDGCDVPAINISGATMGAKLRGFVDRVDLWEKDDSSYLRVVDYKTGKKDFDYCDIYNGYGLQMLLYLFALEDANYASNGNRVIPAGVQYFPARVPLVSADGPMDDEEAAEARIKLWKRKGLLLCDDAVLSAMENFDMPRRMPFSRKRDGSISGDLADSKQFHMLRQFVFSTVGKMVDAISSGSVTANPYTRGASHNACTFCPYGLICHAQSVEGRRNYQSISSQQFWADIEKEVHKDG